MSTMTASVKQRLEDLASRVESSSQNAAERLRDLADAVVGGAYAETWAAADIFQIIDPDTIANQVEAHGASGGIIRFLEVLRNALVFAPIAVTWFGIWRALENYGAAVEADPVLAEQSFLYLWQQGFDDPIFGWMTLSIIALIDALLLGLIFLLTLVVMARNNAREHYAEQIRDDLAAVLADASLVLTSRRTIQNESLVYHFDQASQALLAELHQERLRVQELANRKEKEVGDLTTFTHNFATSTQGMLAAAQALQQTPLQVESLLASLTSTFQRLIDQQHDQQKDVLGTMEKISTQLRLLTDTYRVTSVDFQGMGTNLQAMGTSLQTTSADLRDGVHALQNAALQHTQSASDIRTASGNLAAAQTQFLASLAHERGTLEKGIQSIQASIQALQQVSQALEQDITQLSRTIQQMNSGSQGEVRNSHNHGTTETQELPEVQRSHGG